MSSYNSSGEKESSFIISKRLILRYNRLLRSLKVSRIIIDEDNNNNYYLQLFNEMNNENCVMLVIQNMNLAIIMSKQIAFKFDYIKDIVHKYGTCSKILNYNINIFIIDDKWDTSKWCQNSLYKFHDMINCVTKRPISYFISVKKEGYGIYSHIDINFLEALSWNSDNNQDNTIVRDPSNNSQFYMLEPEPVYS